MKIYQRLLLLVFILIITSCDEDSVSHFIDDSKTMSNEELSIEAEEYILDYFEAEGHLRRLPNWLSQMTNEVLREQARKHSINIATENGENLHVNCNEWEDRKQYFSWHHEFVPDDYEYIEIVTFGSAKSMINKQFDSSGIEAFSDWKTGVSNVDLGDFNDSWFSQIDSAIDFYRLEAFTVGVGIIGKNDNGSNPDEYDYWDIVVTYIVLLSK
ncbi:MAG: hypothetical protein KAH48_12095 [Chlorobi bacterium]|nr:hypothetical protein [Chlorobiota bacterium]